MWEYRATPTNVVDGDTLDVSADLGFSVTLDMRLRLLGVDAFEAKGATKAKGDAATAFTRQWLLDHADAGGRVLIKTIPDRRQRDEHDSFGRYLAIVTDIGGTSVLNDALVIAGHTTGRYE